MEFVKKGFIILLVILTLNLYLPKMAFSQQQVVSADEPKHQPQSWGTPEEDIPTIKEKEKRSGWTWVILLALIGGAAAAVAGGGGNDGDNSGGGSDTGSFTGSW